MSFKNLILILKRKFQNLKCFIGAQIKYVKFNIFDGHIHSWCSTIPLEGYSNVVLVGLGGRQLDTFGLHNTTQKVEINLCPNEEIEL